MMTLWDESGKKKLRKHYLTMFLREAHEVYRQTHGEPVSFSVFCDLRPKNVLLLQNSPKDQCKCVTHENLFFKLDAIGISYDSSFWQKVLCSVEDNSDCWNSKCEASQNYNNLKTMGKSNHRKRNRPRPGSIS